MSTTTVATASKIHIICAIIVTSVITAISAIFVGAVDTIAIFLAVEAGASVTGAAIATKPSTSSLITNSIITIIIATVIAYLMPKQ